MNRPVNAWSCPNCGTAGFAEQNFCRRCGAPRPTKRPAPITEQVPAIRTDGQGRATTKPLSRVRLALVALLFVVLGGLAALILDDIRGAVPTNPAVPTISTNVSRNRGSVSTAPTAGTTGG